MLTRSQVQPFVIRKGSRISVRHLSDPHGRVVPFLDRLCRLVRRLEGRPRSTIEEALRRQERRVRDASRLGGLARTLLMACRFEPTPGTGQLAELRPHIFEARGRRWPPVPGDTLLPYVDVATAHGLDAAQLYATLYADRQAAWVLRAAPAWDGGELLAQYNLELARALLRDAERVEVRTKGGWRHLFSAVKLARLMHTLDRVGRSYRLTVTGPAAAFVVRPSRYGVRFARIVPALSRSPAWQLRAVIRDGDIRRTFTMRGQARGGGGGGVRVGPEPTRQRFDSAWERRFARDFKTMSAAGAAGWTLSRERSPLSFGGRVFLPDFTLRHTDGREAMVELVGFWTPEYLAEKAAKVTSAGDVPLVLVVARSLAVGGAAEALVQAAGDRIVWCGARPRIGDVMRIVEAVATPVSARPR